MPDPRLARLRAAVEQNGATALRIWNDPKSSPDQWQNARGAWEAYAVVLALLDAEAGEPEPQAAMYPHGQCSVVHPEHGHCIHGAQHSGRHYSNMQAWDAPPPSDARERDALRYAIMEYDAGRLSAHGLGDAILSAICEELKDRKSVV